MDEAINPRWEQFRELPNHPEMSVFPDREPRIRHQDVLDGEIELECPKCKYNLTGVSGAYCPECGIDIASEPISVFAAGDISLAWAAALVMDRAAISNMIVSGNFDPIIGMFATKSGMTHLMVPMKFVHDAIELLDSEFGKRIFKLGEKPAPKETSPDWICPHCGEENPGGFEICWQCGESAEPAS